MIFHPCSRLGTSALCPNRSSTNTICLLQSRHSPQTYFCTKLTVVCSTNGEANDADDADFDSGRLHHTASQEGRGISSFLIAVDGPHARSFSAHPVNARQASERLVLNLLSALKTSGSSLRSPCESLIWRMVSLRLRMVTPLAWPYERAAASYAPPTRSRRTSHCAVRPRSGRLHIPSVRQSRDQQTLGEATLRYRDGQ